MTAAEYINNNLLRHGWGESWVPELSLEQLAALRAIADAEMVAALTYKSEDDND